MVVKELQWEPGAGADLGGVGGAGAVGEEVQQHARPARVAHHEDAQVQRRPPFSNKLCPSRARTQHTPAC